MNENLRKWQELPFGGVVVSSDSSTSYKTGAWSRKKINFSPKDCIHCGLCWSACPDASIIFADGKMKGIKEDHCKKCGLCAKACPKNCITL